MTSALSLLFAGFLFSLHTPFIADEPPVQLDPIPQGLPAVMAAEFQSRATDLEDVKQKLQTATRSWNARCDGVREGEARYDGCASERRELDCGRDELYRLRREFNIDLEAAARAAGVADHLTLTNVSIQGEVNFPIPEGTNVSGGRIASIRVAPGTRITTGPTGRFSASVPGGNGFELGGGASVTLDNTFVNPHATDKVDTDLTHGFFRFLRDKVESYRGGRGVRRQGVCAVRG